MSGEMSIPETRSDLGHDEEFFLTARGIQGKISVSMEDAINGASNFGISVGEYAQILIARELQVISYAVWHQARFASPERDMVAEFAPFAERYIKRRGKVTKEEMEGLYEDFHGIQLKKEKEK